MESLTIIWGLLCPNAAMRNLRVVAAMADFPRKFQGRGRYPFLQGPERLSTNQTSANLTWLTLFCAVADQNLVLFLAIVKRFWVTFAGGEGGEAARFKTTVLNSCPGKEVRLHHKKLATERQVSFLALGFPSEGG